MYQITGINQVSEILDYIESVMDDNNRARVLTEDNYAEEFYYGNYNALNLLKEFIRSHQPEQFLKWEESQ